MTADFHQRRQMDSSDQKTSTERKSAMLRLRNEGKDVGLNQRAESLCRSLFIFFNYIKSISGLKGVKSGN